MNQVHPSGSGRLDPEPQSPDSPTQNRSPGSPNHNPASYNSLGNTRRNFNKKIAPVSNVFQKLQREIHKKQIKTLETQTNPDKEAPKELNYNFRFHGKEFAFAENSLYFLGPTSKFRLKICQITTHDYFERIVLIIVIINTLLLIMTDYSDRIDESPKYPFLQDTILHSEKFFTILYTIEAIFKIVAKGFLCGQGTYLKSGWDVLDFIVVLTGLFDITNNWKLGFIALIRMLKPLKGLLQISKTKVILNSLFMSIKYLKTTMFFLLVY